MSAMRRVRSSIRSASSSLEHQLLNSWAAHCRGRCMAIRPARRPRRRGRPASRAHPSPRCRLHRSREDAWRSRPAARTRCCSRPCVQRVVAVDDDAHAVLFGIASAGASSCCSPGELGGWTCGDSSGSGHLPHSSFPGMPAARRERSAAIRRRRARLQACLARSSGAAVIRSRV